MFRGYFRFVTLVVLLALCSIDRVSTIKCSVCDSDIDKDCVTGDKPKFAVECDHHSFLPTSEKQYNNAEKSEYDCGYAQGESTIDMKVRVIRGCASPSTTCETYSRIYKADHNIELKDCKRCNNTLCNSSGHLKTGIWSFSICLIALYFFKL